MRMTSVTMTKDALVLDERPGATKKRKLKKGWWCDLPHATAMHLIKRKAAVAGAKKKKRGRS